MPISSKQIGWSQESNLLWQISKQLNTLTGISGTNFSNIIIALSGKITNEQGVPAFYADTFINIPAAGQPGRLFVSTDTFAFYRDNGVGWDLIGGPGTGTITGSGTTGKYSLFSGTSTIGDSSLTEGVSKITSTKEFEATKLILTGGTSSEILAADGSVITAGSGITIAGGTISSAGGGTNIYNTNGTLTGNRTLTTGGFDLIFTGSKTAASGVATFINYTPILIANANNNVLTALDITSTFTNGAFTGVKNYAIKTNSNILINNVLAGKGITNINRNTSFGDAALTGINTSGIDNTAIGFTTLTSVTSGAGNTAIGAAMLYSITSGNGNVGVGSSVMQNLTTGSDNIGIGRSVLEGAGTNSSNIGIGTRSLFSTSGNQNVAIGFESLYSQTTGAFNIALGHLAGRYITGGTGNTISNNSIFIGADARANAINETNQIVIGHAAFGLGSNTSVIGNSSTTFGRWWGNLLLGTSTNSTYLLDVNGTAKVNSTFQIGNNSDNGAILVFSSPTSRLSWWGSQGAANQFINNSKIGDLFIRPSAIAALNMYFWLSRDNVGEAGYRYNFGNGLAIYKDFGTTFTTYNSSILSLDSQTRGFLPPRMTTAQKTAIATPAAGLVVYDTDLAKLCVYTTAWETITSA